MKKNLTELVFILDRSGSRVSFRFWVQAQPKNAAGILHNRRACSALQGIGGRATNKQSARSPTIALLASFDRSYCFTGMRIFSTDSSFPLIVRMARVIS